MIEKNTSELKNNREDFLKLYVHFVEKAFRQLENNQEEIDKNNTLMVNSTYRHPYQSNPP